MKRFLQESCLAASVARWFVAVALIGVVPAAARTMAADEPAKEKPAGASADKPKAATDDKAAAKGDGEAKVKAEVIAVPDGTAEELLKFIRQQMSHPPGGKSREEQIANYGEMQRSIVAAADKVLASKDASDEKEGDKYAAAALMAKLRALDLLHALGDDAAVKQAGETIEKYSNDKREHVSALISQFKLKQRFSLPPSATPADAKKMVADVKDYFGKNPVQPQNLQILMRLGGEVETVASASDAADLYDFLGDQLKKNEDPRLANLAKKFVGMARRVRLMGHPMEVFGKKLDGKEFDWKAYQGKVVLVDFWATWCGPCVQELPNVQKNYEEYHAKGFDVIGISLDEDRQDVEKFINERKIPWTILFSDDATATGWEHPLAAHYGIMGIPTVILVDQKGNVVSLNARGPELGKLLAKLLGEGKSDAKPAEKAAPEKKD